MALPPRPDSRPPGPAALNTKGPAPKPPNQQQRQRQNGSPAHNPGFHQQAGEDDEDMFATVNHVPQSARGGNGEQLGQQTRQGQQSHHHQQPTMVSANTVLNTAPAASSEQNHVSPAPPGPIRFHRL